MSPFPSTSPLDGSGLAAVQATSPSEVAALVARARDASRAWAAMSVGERIDRVMGARKRLLERAEEIAELVRRECGKPIEEALLAEVLPNADLFDYWAASIEELLEGADLTLDPLAYPGKSGRVRKVPRGVVALITPWNYPVAIPLRTLVPALLAGNVVVFKPSEITARSGALVASLFEGLLPEGVLTLAQGAGDVGGALVDANVDLVVFTGSVATGRRIAVRCAEQLVACSLELGGKDAAIVLSDCDVERTARGLVWGAFTNAGQNCASIERVYVEKAIAPAIEARVLELTKQLVAGVDTATLTTQAQRAIVARHLDEAIASGSEVLAGGAPEGDSLAFPPTVVRIKDRQTPLFVDETFGPILPIFVVDDVDEAVRLANDSRYGLTTSVWTKSRARGRAVAEQLTSGVVTINNHGFTAALPSAPWTGTGETGGGVTNGPHALSSLVRPRLVLEDANGAKRELWWYPYTPTLRTIALAMAKLRGGAGIGGRIAALFALLVALPKRLFGRG